MGVLPHEIYLLNYPYNGESQQGWRYSLQRYPWETCPSYDVLEYMDVESDSHNASILIDDEPTTIQSPLADALAHVVRQGESRRLWIETLCLGHQRALNSKERSGKIKFFRTSAQNVTMWIGRDEEPDDILGEYLGPGTVSSTDAAFSLCRSLAESEDPRKDLQLLLAVRAQHSGKAARCHLANLLYRPWFREMALLQTNYVGEIPSIIVTCGTSQVEWAQVETAAARMRMLCPIPALFEHSFIEVFTSHSHVQKWLEARRRFGFHEFRLLAQAMWLQETLSTEDSAADSERNPNLLSWIGMISTIIDYDAQPSTLELLDVFISWEQRREDELQTPGSLSDLPPLTTLQVQQPSRSAPDPEFQSHYVARRVNIQHTLPLLKLFPHMGDVESPLQGSMRFFSRADPPPFIIVYNATLKDYRHNSLILVDGHAFSVPKALEIMLRCVRHAEDATLLFIWRMCWAPHDATVADEGHVSVSLTDYFDQTQQLAIDSDGSIDMYEILMAASNPLANDPGNDSMGNDWLLDLLDEAQINDVLPTRQRRKEEKNR